MSKKQKRNLTLLVTAYFLASGYHVAGAASADSFKTPEYYESGSLDIINAADAYAKGYTGKGVTLGICDFPVNFSNPELSGKPNSVAISSDGVYDWSLLNHGTHVAGIAAAAKNNLGMHGVAFDAAIAASNIIGKLYDSGSFDLNEKAFDYYNAHPAIKLINNSWGTGEYLDQMSADSYEDLLQDAYWQGDFTMMKNAVQNDKLLIFSAGNAGHPMPVLESMLPYFDSQCKNNLLSVTALNGDEIRPTASGGFSGGSNMVAVFSDLAKYAEDYTVTAPGWFISSANADFAADGQIDITMNGTSMAAPAVTGAGALVQQAHPYMNAKQIGDTLLSTAHNKIAISDGYIATIQEDGAQKTFNLFYFTGTRQTPEQLKQAVIAYYNANDWACYGFYGIESEDHLKSMLDSGELAVRAYYDVPLEAFIGQGIVDAGKAVNGPGALNARRLTAADRTNAYQAAGEAMYGVDTQGYNAVWSNDIRQIKADFIARDSSEADLRARWQYYDTNWLSSADPSSRFMTEKYIAAYNQYVAENGLQELDVGLYKTGAGILSLTGNNTYLGSSVAAGGTLQIDGSVAGNAWSVDEGTIGGSGIIGGSLYNNGLVSAGSWGGVGTLQVGQNFSGNGTLEVLADGKDNGKIAVAGTADLSQMKISAAAGSLYKPNTEYTYLTAGSIVGSDYSGDFSGLLDIEATAKNTASAGGKTAVFTTVPGNNTGVHDDTFRALNSMYYAIGENERGQAERMYGMNVAQATAGLHEITGGFQLNMAHDILANPALKNALQARPDDGEALWFNMDKAWRRGDDGARGRIRVHNFAMTMGKDFYQNDNKYWGAMASYGDNTLTQAGNNGTYKDYRLGIYGGMKNGAANWSGYLAYGWQDNAATRRMTAMGLTADADYDSSSLSLGVEYSYDLKNSPEQKWQITPYAGVMLAHYSQDGYREHNAGIFNQQWDDYSDDYGSGELGIRFTHAASDGSYGAKIGYKRVFSGASQTANVRFAAEGGNFAAQSAEGSKNYVSTGLYAQKQLGNDWFLDGSMNYEWSQKDKVMNAAVKVSYIF